VKQIFVIAGFLLVTPISAAAQITVNPAALQQLAGVVAPPPVVEEIAAPTPVAHHRAHTHHLVQAVAHGKPPAPVAAAARITAPAAKPEPAPATPKPISPVFLAPVSLAFAPGSDDLPANATAALKPFCTPASHIAIDARAPSDPSDPSAAMRLSLSRAMAVQQALTACGVPSQNILPRADGNVPGKNEDETLIGSGEE